jgi:serine/threonine-protein kinase RsbW
MSDRIKNGIQKSNYYLEIPAECENLRHVCEFVSGIAGSMGFSDQQLHQIELIVDEACTNIIKHAYPNGNYSKKTIQARVKKCPEKIEIVIADRGAGFDPAAIKNPDLKEYQKRMIMGGLGLYLIKQFSDEVHFRIHPGVRNEVKMVKFLIHPQLQTG